MKRQLWLSMIWLAMPLLTAQAQGISFFQGTWDEAKVKAKAENKLIFVDAYAVWCGPCKWMASNAFPDAAVGEYFNKYFIAVKMDMEKSSNAAFAKQYPVEAYPTLFFIKSDGKIADKVVGAQDAAGLLAVGKDIQKKHGSTPINSGGGGNNSNTVVGNKKVLKYSGGSFESSDGSNWTENAADGTHKFKVEREDETYYYLKDATRGTQVALPKQGGASFILQNGSWVDLYQLTLSSDANFGNKPVVNKKAYSFAYTNGSFDSDDTKSWTESQNGKVVYSFSLEREDETYYYLIDKSRGVRVAMPKEGGQCFVERNGAWDDLYEVAKQ